MQQNKIFKTITENQHILQSNELKKFKNPKQLKGKECNTENAYVTCTYNEIGKFIETHCYKS